MKSQEVYQLIHQVLGGWMKANGFRKLSNGVYSKPAHTLFLLVIFSGNKHGWDPYAGSDFATLFHISRENAVYMNPVVWFNTITQLLSDEELAVALRERNRIVARLKPPGEDVLTQVYREEYKRKLYMTLFAPETLPYRIANGGTRDIDMRYFEPGDVLMWAQFVLDKLPRIVPRLEIIAAELAHKEGREVDR
jgi:hypothetical protein